MLDVAAFKTLPRVVWRQLSQGMNMAAAKVEIYTQWGCGYCTRAKALLDAKGAPYTEHDVTMGGAPRAALRLRAPSAATVPQIFIDDQAIGGSDDLYALDRAGKLDALLGT
jgi:glutaredoxin 3